MKIKNGFAKREIAGSNIVVPVGDAIKEFNGMVTLNASGSFIWDCFTEERSIDEVAKMVTEEFDIDFETAKRDVEKFAEMLKQNGLTE